MDILDADDRPTTATTFLLVHRALRRDLMRLPIATRLLPARDGQQAQRLRAYWQVFREALDQHHAGEDEVLFPALLRQEPGVAGVLDGLTGDHAALDLALERLDARMAALPDAPEAAAAALEELARMLGRHLDLEEEHLVPVMLRSRTAVGTAAGDRAGSRPVDGTTVAWTLEGLDDGTVAALAAGLPPGVAGQLEQWRSEHAVRTSAVWRDLAALRE